MIIHHHVGGKGIKQREDALEDFYKYHDEHNGNRRKSIRELAKITQVRQDGRGGWDVYYSVPSRLLKR